jgi:transposase
MGAPVKVDQVLRIDENGHAVTIAEHVVEKLRTGNYVEQAAKSAGLHKSTVYDWLHQGARISTDILQGRRTRPRAGSVERKLLDFSDAVAAAEAEWEVAANDGLERLSQPRTVTETRETVETDSEGKETGKKTMTLTKVEEADSATIRWRLERRFPDRYGKQHLEISGPGGGPIPLSIREQAAKQLTDQAERLAQAAAAAQAPPEEPEQS